MKKDLVTLRTAWNWAVHMGHLKRPFPSRGLRFGKTIEKPPFQTVVQIEKRLKSGGLTKAQEADLWDCAFLTLSDVEELLAHVRAAARQPFVYPLFVFAAHIGARRSEMLRSELTDIDFEAGSVLIHEKKRVRGKLSTRRVPLSPFLKAALLEWLKIHPGGGNTFSRSPESERTKSERGLPLPITPDEAHEHFKRTLRGSRFERLRGWHVFRHSFCSNAAGSGEDQRLINAWVGHQTEEMVQRYRHLIPDQQQEAICRVFGGGGAIG
ncbi:MAG: site-specific integrase [Pirellulales bacterium]